VDSQSLLEGLRTSSSKNQLTLTLQRANFFQAQLIQLQDDAGRFRKPEIRKLIARKPIDYLIYFIKRQVAGSPTTSSGRLSFSID